MLCWSFPSTPLNISCVMCTKCDYLFSFILCVCLCVCAAATKTQSTFFLFTFVLCVFNEIPCCTPYIALAINFLAIFFRPAVDSINSYCQSFRLPNCFVSPQLTIFTVRHRSFTWKCQTIECLSKQRCNNSENIENQFQMCCGFYDGPKIVTIEIINNNSWLWFMRDFIRKCNVLSYMTRTNGKGMSCDRQSVSLLSLKHTNPCIVWMMAKTGPPKLWLKMRFWLMRSNVIEKLTIILLWHFCGYCTKFNTVDG